MNNTGVKNGLFFGAATVALYLVIYIINKRLLFSPVFGPMVSLVIPIVFMVLAAKATRNNQEGVMTFGESLSATFLTFVIGSLIYSAFSYLMTNIIDPSLLEIGKEIALEALDKVSGVFGMSEDQLDQMREAIEDGGGNGFANTAIAWAFSLIFPGFIIALIISAIMKRNPSA